MARLGSIFFDIFFWIAAFCLSPLILCYFLLVGLRSCLVSILRLWQCPPSSTPTLDPYDPDVEAAKGTWPEEKNGTKVAKAPTFEAPTVQQVLHVKKMFASMRFTKLWEKGVNDNMPPSTSSNASTTQKSGTKLIRLPPEVSDMILDMAEYWPCTKTVVSRLMLISNGSPGATSVWMDKERDWRGNTPGASKKSQPWRRTPSALLGRALDEDSTTEASTVVNGIYLRSFPLGGDMKLVIPDSARIATAKKKPKPKTAEVSADANMTDSSSSWQKLSNILRNGTWKIPIGSVVELDKRNDEASGNRGVLTTNFDGTIKAPRHAPRPLHPAEACSWCLEVDELYPNVRPDINHEKFEKKEKRRTRQQWRSFYTMSRFHRLVVPIYQLYSSTREEKFLVERTVESTLDTPFERREILEPRLMDRTLSHCGERRMRSAKVRKIVWTIWSKEMIDRSMNERRIHINPEGSPDLTWFEMFVEEPVEKGSADPEIVWKRKYPKGNENILVQRDLGHRIRTTNEPWMRVHRTVWDWDDWEDTEPDDDGEDDGNWTYRGIDQLELGNILTGPTHPFRHTTQKNYCNCPFGTKLHWGDSVEPSKIAPVSSRLKPDETSAPTGPLSPTSSSSSSGSPSSSNSATSSSSSSGSSSTNSSSNSLLDSTKLIHSHIAPNTVLEERFKTGSLRKNGALGKLVRSLRMGDRLVLVARAGGGLGWSQLGHRWDVGVYRAEVEVYWAV